MACWLPTCTKCDMEILEKVQHGATKLSFAKQQISYKQQLEKLDLPTLIYFRKRGDVIFAFKMVTSDTIKPISNHSEYNRTWENSAKLR